MGVRFNPFTAQLDLTGSGSGGGGSSVITGAVDTFADLPETLGTPPIDAVFLVREASGAFNPFATRRFAGLYIRSDNTGTRANDYTFLGAYPDLFLDGNFLLANTATPSKQAAFDLSAIASSTTRTLTVPDASGRLQVEGQPIGNTTPSAGTFTTLAANNGTLTASAPVLDLAQTWNAGGVTFTGLKFSATNTASAPASVIADFSLGSTSVFAVTKNGVRLRNGVGGTIDTLLTTNAGPQGGDLIISSSAGGNTFRFIAFSNDCFCDNSANGAWIFRAQGEKFRVTNAGAIQLNSDQVTLIPETANILAQRRTTNAQTYRLYNSFSSATNFERLNVRWASNELIIDAQAGSAGGTLRGIKLGSASTSLLGFFGATPAVQGAAVADATDAGTTQDRLNDLLARIRTLGLIAT